VSIFSWLFSKPVSQPNSPPVAQRPVVSPKQPAPPPGAAMPDLKQQRQDRRDHLYSVVRDVMLRSEVLASHYKFKVLSLDTQGRQFLVMMDLLGEQSLRPEQLAGIETLISNTAAQRYALQVKSVYWRQPVLAEVSPPVASTTPMTPVAASGMVAAAPATRPAAAATVPQDMLAPTPRGRGGAKSQGFDPISDDEVLAFKNAIATKPAPAAQASSGQALVSGLRNAAAMTGFEDTQLLEPEEPASPLSRTQFGDL